MRVVAYEIEERTKASLLDVASERDFRLRPARTSLNGNQIATSPSVSLYCIDPTSGNVLLTETPEGIDIASSTFVYETQYLHANRVYVMDINDLLTITQALPQPPTVLFIHSTGRCGSTLLAKALGSNGVTTFSEPDIFTQLALLGCHGSQGAVDAIVTLYESFAKFFIRGRTGPVTFKLRSVCSEHAVYMMAALPSAKSLFLYRNAAEVARSYARVTGRSLGTWLLSEEEQRAWSVLVPLIRDRVGQINGYDLMAAIWAGPVLRYSDSYSQSGWLGALDYADLIADPSGVLSELLRQIGSNKVLRASLDMTFAVHAQSGSNLDPVNIKSSTDLEKELVAQDFTMFLEKALWTIDEGLSAGMRLPNKLSFPDNVLPAT